MQLLGLPGKRALGILGEQAIELRSGLGLPCRVDETLGEPEQHLVEALVVGEVREEALVARDRRAIGLSRALVEEPGQVLGAGETLAAIVDARARRLGVARGGIGLEEPLELAERLLGVRLVAVGAILLEEEAFADLVLRVVALGVRRVESQEIAVGRYGQDVVAGAAFPEVAVAQGEPRLGAVLALREAVDDTLEVLPGRFPVLLGRGLLTGLPDDLVGVAGQGRDVGRTLVGARGEERGQEREEPRGALLAAHHAFSRIQSHSRRRPSARATVERKPRSRWAAEVSAAVSLMSPF